MISNMRHKAGMIIFKNCDPEDEDWVEELDFYDQMDGD